MILPDSYDRTPPHSLDAEMCLLSAMMLESSIIPPARRIVTREAFYQPDHQIIFDVLSDLQKHGSAIDSVILREALIKRNLYDEIGGRESLGKILASLPSSAHWEFYARIIVNLYRKRQGIHLANEILRTAYTGSGDPDDGAKLLSDAATSFARAATDGASADYVTADQALTSLREQMNAGGIPTIPTGITALDERIRGLTYGEMMLLAARPSMGKSIVSKQIMRSVARSSVGVGYIALEESVHKIMRNCIAAEASLENHRVRYGNLSDEEWTAYDAAESSLMGLPIYFETKCRSTDSIRNMIATWKARHDIRLVIIDHIGLVGASGRTPYERASNASRELAETIREAHVAGVVLAQLSRAVTGRDDKRPGMADLRDSGRMEEDADGIVFLHREDYYHTTDQSYAPDRIAELIIAKWRDGERGGTVRLRSSMAFQRFEELPIEVPEFL